MRPTESRPSSTRPPRNGTYPAPSRSVPYMAVDDLEAEAQHATELLAGKTVRRVWRHRLNEVGIEFEDGTRLFIETEGDAVELSITGG